MRCSHCNEPLSEGDEFCPNCWQPVSKPIVQQVDNPAAPAPRKKMPGWLLVVIILLAVMICCGVLAAGGYLLYTNQNVAVAVDNQPVSNLQFTVSAQETAIAALEAQPHQEQPTQEQEAAPQVEPTDADIPNIVEGGVEVWFDESLMQGVRAVQVEETLPGGYIPWDYAPNHLSLEVQNPKGVIHLVPVNAYVPMGEFADETIRELRSTLQNRPGVAAWGCIPTWDFPCPHQQMNIHISYFDFQNGNGIRSVTVYAIQNTSAINNEAIDYYYNGLTEDGQYYLYANFDLRHTSLTEDDWEVPLEVMTDMTGEKLKEYVIQYGEMLESSPDGYQPQLSILDDAVKSLRVEGE